MLKRHFLHSYETYKNGFMAHTAEMMHDLQRNHTKKVDRILNRYIKKYGKWPTADITNKAIKTVAHAYMESFPKKHLVNRKQGWNILSIDDESWNLYMPPFPNKDPQLAKYPFYRDYVFWRGLLATPKNFEDFYSVKELRRLKLEYRIPNYLIKVNHHRGRLIENITPAELKAQNSLRDLITETDWRRYVVNGFLMVRGGKTGYWYQIWHNSASIKIYDQGKDIGTLCIHTEGNLPATDHILNIKTLIELDENMLWEYGNIHSNLAS